MFKLFREVCDEGDDVVVEINVDGDRVRLLVVVVARVVVAVWGAVVAAVTEEVARAAL